MNINNFIKYIQQERGYSELTVKAYRNDLISFNEFIAKEYEIYDLNSINHDIIRSWIIKLLDERNSNSTVNRKLSSLRSFYNYLLKIGTVKSNPLKNINSLKVPSRLPEFVRKDDISKLFKDFEKTDGFSNFRDFLVLELLYVTGIRLSELINLKEENINFVNNQLKVRGKRNKERMVPFSLKIQEHIIRYMEMKKNEFGEENPYLIVTDKGEKAYEKFIYRIVTKSLSPYTKTKKSPHVLRHTFATHMLNNGADLISIKELLGHASLAATQVYTHNTIEQLKLIYNNAHPRAHIKKEV